MEAQVDRGVQTPDVGGERVDIVRHELSERTQSPLVKRGAPKARVGSPAIRLTFSERVTTNS
jgi:hypothetical protein